MFSTCRRIKGMTFRAAAAVALALLVPMQPETGTAAERVPITVANVSPGAPITMGIPFPMGALHSPDHVRVLNAAGAEIPSQVTEVSTWEPANSSIKWIWIFFFADEYPSYEIEFGPEVRRMPLEGAQINIRNDQRENGSIRVDTGPLRFTVRKGGSGFIDLAELDLDGDGFSAADVIVRGPEARGSFLDLADGEARHASRAVIDQFFIEKGSGPLHGIIRIEGEYRYEDAGKNPSPFVTRIHAYAGRSFIRVLHTITYTGEPDRSRPVEGEHAEIATQPDRIIDEQERLRDPGLRIPKDRLAAAGIALLFEPASPARAAAGYRSGRWWENGAARIHSAEVDTGAAFSVVQRGPRLDRDAPRPEGPWFLVMPPIPRSTSEERLEGAFAATIAGGGTSVNAERAEGWMDLSDGRRGLSFGIRNFLEEYPKELRAEAGLATAYFWSPLDEPMSFARWSDRADGGMAGSFAQGLAKTSEAVLYFRPAGLDEEAVRRVIDYVLDPPVAHAAPEWYANSGIYGRFAPASRRFPEFERGLEYKYRWMLFNQKWEPWYGMFSHGDWLTYYFDGRWIQWNLNEPAVDFSWWLQFMRTGNREYYLAAEASSRHSMDVGNVHWPAERRYRGDTNPAIDYWRSLDQVEPSPYVGMGRRHANEHWVALLTAHAWVQGWLAAYYLTGYHRGLEVAELTGRMYLRRQWGEHGLTGRRLYLSVQNLAELYDATKDPAYRRELDDRVERMLGLQRLQGDNLIMERYSYAQSYASHGLRHYWEMTGDESVRAALVRHARRLRDVPPLDHDMESYLASIHGLLAGYEFTKERSFLDEAVRRARYLQTAPLPEGFAPRNQREFAEALEAVSALPQNSEGRFTNWMISSGLRVFGWTHAFNVPWLLYWLEEASPVAE